MELSLILTDSTSISMKVLGHSLTLSLVSDKGNVWVLNTLL